MKKILVPVSFSETSKNALHHAAALAKQYGASLSLLHTYPAQKYNREYDFGKEDYDIGIRRMLDKFYHECMGNKGNHPYDLITHSGSVSDIISKISSPYSLLVMSRKIGLQPKSNRYLSDKIFHISTQSRCPVLMTPANQEEISFQKARTIWHIQRSELERDLVNSQLGQFGIDANLVVAKSLLQENFVSAFWKNLVTYTKTHDATLLKSLPGSFEDEHIDLLILVNSLKGLFERFIKDDAFQIISQFSVPIMIFQAKN